MKVLLFLGTVVYAACMLGVLGIWLYLGWQILTGGVT